MKISKNLGSIVPKPPFTFTGWSLDLGFSSNQKMAVLFAQQDPRNDLP
jgi:hypothetical protein